MRITLGTEVLILKWQKKTAFNWSKSGILLQLQMKRLVGLIVKNIFLKLYSQTICLCVFLKMQKLHTIACRRACRAKEGGGVLSTLKPTTRGEEPHMLAVRIAYEFWKMPLHCSYWSIGYKTAVKTNQPTNSMVWIMHVELHATKPKK